MSIGIMDGDILNYAYTPFNLEVMKLSAYYKKKGEVVTLAPKFTPKKHSKLFYRKDYDDGIYPPKLGAQINVEYGGHAFSGVHYIPLDSSIEKCKPDTYIYSKLKGKVLTYKEGLNNKPIFDNMMKAEHCRLSLDGKTIWGDYERQIQDISDAYWVFFHDWDLNKIENSFEEISRLLARGRALRNAKTRICTKFPIQVDNGEDLLKWFSLNSSKNFYTVRYDGIMEPEVFGEWIDLIKQNKLYAQLEYHVTAERYEPNDFVENLLPKIFRQVIISRSHMVFFSLIYDKGYFPDERWELVIDLFNQYHNSYIYHFNTNYFNVIGDDTLYDFARNIDEIPRLIKARKVITKQEIREIFAFVREYNYPLFKDFYECSANKLLGGKI